MDKLSLPMRFERHVKEWEDCKRCELCEGRQYVILVRGDIPCDVLFIGEAPGESENCLGQPFVGPAGQLLDDIIKKAIPHCRVKDHDDASKDQFVPEVSYAFTNLVGCIPRKEDGGKLKQPPPDSIKACAPRVLELTEMCSPKLIVCVGKLPEEWLHPKIKYSIKVDPTIPRMSMLHPSAILQGAYAQRPLSIKRQVIALQAAIRGLHAGTR